jgi:hypothetical protein
VATRHDVTAWFGCIARLWEQQFVTFPAMLATSRSALRPQLSDLGEGRSLGIANRNLDGSFAVRIRFSAARYSFCSRSSWVPEPVTYASSRSHCLFLMLTDLTLGAANFGFLTLRASTFNVEASAAV